MVTKVEDNYARLVDLVLVSGEERETRNHATLSVFGLHLTFDAGASPALLQGRKMYYKGIIGELAAMLRGPKSVEDFTRWGCNYWEKWADKDGKLELDYGNAWLENGQVDHLKHCLANNRTDRRMLINAWRPERLADLSLPCCHYGYQFYVRGDKYLDMLWMQRSVDMMVGLPSDIFFAQLWLTAIANEFCLIPGNVTMSLGDCHIYKDHVDNAKHYLANVNDLRKPNFDCLKVEMKWLAPAGKDFLLFEPSDVEITAYDHLEPLKFTLHE